jgi:hypothetical protein
MQTPRFDLKSKYWLATALALTAGLFGWPPGIFAAVGLTAVQLAHFALREPNLRTLVLQVRALYLALLLLGLWPPLAALHVLQGIGVWANVLFGYCVAARTLSLLPGNRRVPLTARLVARTFLTRPGAGSILGRISPAKGTRAAGKAAGCASAGTTATRSPARP